MARGKDKNPRKARPIAERFLAKFERGEPDECWPWEGAKTTRGYGLLTRGRRGAGYVYAHRFALEMATGRPVPTDVEVCHTCDNPGCVNPAHLFEGIHNDNMADMVAKGRAKGASGKPHSSKLCAEEVIQIRALLEAGHGINAIGRSFNISRAAVQQIRDRRTWAWLP